MSDKSGPLPLDEKTEKYNESIDDIRVAVDILLKESNCQIGTPEILRIKDNGNPNYTAIAKVPISGELQSPLPDEERFLTTEQFKQDWLPKPSTVSIETVNITEKELVIFIAGFPKGAIEAAKKFKD